MSTSRLSEKDRTAWLEFLDSHKDVRIRKRVNVTGQANPVSDQTDINEQDLADWENWLSNKSSIQNICEPIQFGKLHSVSHPGSSNITDSKNRLPKNIPSSSRQLSDVEFNKKTFEKLRSGKLHPENQLDLHGLTYEQARLQINNFLNDAFNKGSRLVLVIPGKGSRSQQYVTNYGRSGILNRMVPNLLSKNPLQNIVQHFELAHRLHGGAGAYYVILRRRKIVGS